MYDLTLRINLHRSSHIITHCKEPISKLSSKLFFLHEFEPLLSFPFPPLLPLLPVLPKLALGDLILDIGGLGRCRIGKLT
jgi:hypothetical protein